MDGHELLKTLTIGDLTLVNGLIVTYHKRVTRLLQSEFFCMPNKKSTW